MIFLLNLILTPLVITGAPFEQTAATPVFLLRQSVAALTAAMLLVGAIGLYLAQAERAGLLGAVAFVAALLGTALLLAWEWVNVFVLRDLALRAPSALRLLEDTKGLSLYDLGAVIPLALFSIGWIALAVSTMRAWPSQRRPAGILIAGFFVTPLLTAILGPVWGGILGTAVLGFGWFSLGRAVARRE